MLDHGVERSGEQPAGLGQQGQPALGDLRLLTGFPFPLEQLAALGLPPHTVGDVHHGGAHEQHAVVIAAAAHRVVADQPVAELAGGGRRLARHLPIDHRFAGLEHQADVGPDLIGHPVEQFAQRSPDVSLGRQTVDHRQRVVDPQVPQLPVEEPQTDGRRFQDRVEQGQGGVLLVNQPGCLQRDGGRGGDVVGQLLLVRPEPPAQVDHHPFEAADVQLQDQVYDVKRRVRQTWPG